MSLVFGKVKKCHACGQTEKLNSIYWKRMGRVDGKQFYQCNCGSGLLVGMFSDQNFDNLQTRLIIEHLISEGAID